MSALIWCPFPSAAEADEAAARLLEEGLVACANRMGPMHSQFVWNGEISSSEETGVLFKTHERLLEQATRRLEELHPYDTPAIMGWRCDDASAATHQWLRSLVPAREKQG